MSDAAEIYENTIVPNHFKPWATALIEVVSPQPGEHILDVACGTGIVARSAASFVGVNGRVAGLDLSPGMIAVARQSAEREHLSIEWYEGRAEKLPFPDATFDLVFCQFGLMFFSDREAALTEMYRVLKPGGRVALSAWQELEQHPFYQTIHEVTLRHLGRSAVGAVFSLGDVKELTALVTRAGFGEVWVKSVSMTSRFPNPATFLDWEIEVDPQTTPALRNLDTQAQQAVMDAVRGELAEPLRAVTVDHQVVLPFRAHLVSGRTR